MTGDAEGAPTIDVVERLDHYLIDGGIVSGWTNSVCKGLRPFVTAGGGYLRQLHEGLTVIEEGRVFYVGGGARYWIFTRPRGCLGPAVCERDVRLERVDRRHRGRRSDVAGSRRDPVSFFLLF